MRWWEVLGVPPEASEIEIAAAYRRLAKDVHPDAEPGASGVARQERERSMARLNLAYAEARTAVRSIVAAKASTRMPTRAPAKTGAETSEDDEALDGRTPVTAAKSEARPRAHWPVRLVAAVLVGGAAFVALTAQSAPTSTAPTVESCVTWSGEFTRAPCDAPHAGRVVASTTAPERCRSGTSFMRLRHEVLCIDTTR